MTTANQYIPGKSADKEFGPVEIYRLIIRRWKLITGIVAVGVGIVMLFVFLQTPLYTSTTEIIIDPRNKNISGEQDVLSGLGMDAAAIGSQIRIIKSASVARRVIRKLRLYDDPEFNTANSSALSRLIQQFWSRSSDRHQFNGDTKISDADMLGVVNGFSGRVTARRVGKTYIIAISFTSKDAKKSAKIANQIADSYLVSQLQGKFEFNRKVKLWLRERLEELQKKVQGSERAVELYRSKHNLIGVKGKMPYEAEMDGLSEKLILARVEMSEKYTQFQQIKDVLQNKGRLSAVGSLAESEEIKKLRVERARLAQEEAELTTTFTRRHPKVISKRNERRDLERQIEREAAKIIDNIKAGYDASKSKVAAIEQRLKQLQRRSQRERGALIKLRELQREATADRAVYNSFLERFKQKSQQEKSRTADTRVIEKAVPSRIPSSPNKRRAALLACAGFLALGIGFAFLLEMMDNSFKTPEEVEVVLNSSHLVSVPKISKSDLSLDGQDLPLDRYAVMKPLTPFAEAMRTLKVCLELSNLDAPPQVILITSVLPNEGKSSICSNFAQHAASVGARTLLIDADLRNPSLSARLCSGQSNGLVDLLSQRVSREEVIVKDHTGLDILPGQAVPYNSAEILGSASMKALLTELRNDYDLIILDTSPVMPVIDAKVLVEIVDSLVLVVEWDKTPKDAVRNSLNTLDPERKKLAGVIFNKLISQRMKGYGGTYYGGYYQEGYYGNSG